MLADPVVLSPAGWIRIDSLMARPTYAGLYEGIWTHPGSYVA
jgi:hypothetical protein